MHQQNRKRKVGIVTPPDVKGLRTPSPKKLKENGVQSWNDVGGSEAFIGECGFCLASNSCAVRLAQLKFNMIYFSSRL